MRELQAKLDGLPLNQRYALSEHILSGYSDILSEEFNEIIERCAQYTLLSFDRIYAIHNAINHVCDADIEGDVVECGVWRGGGMMVGALTLHQRKNVSRELYLFDTYAGMPRPSSTDDVDLWGTPAEQLWQNYQMDGVDTWTNCDVDTVKSNLESTAYDLNKCHFIKGLVEDTIPVDAPDKIAFLHIDTDWFSSVEHILNNLYDRVSPGGFVVIDDYGHFLGARRATDEFLAGRREKIFMHRIDYTGRLIHKI